MSLSWWQMPLAVVGLLVLISVPSVVIAALKLHKRNLGPLLDANGWAVNAKARINIPFGRSLTGTAVLPPGSRRDLADPFKPRRPGRTILIVVLLVAVLLLVLWNYGVIENLAPGRLPKSAWVLRREAQSADAPPAETPPPAAAVEGQ